jgi:hypothetical protein
MLGTIFALILQWVSYRLSFRKDQRKEYWIRKLNSYQDFYHHTAHLIELLGSKVSIPDNVYWQSISLARKAVYDAAFYDKTHLNRTDKMKAITLQLIEISKSEERNQKYLNSIAKQIEKMIEEFYHEEKFLSKQPKKFKKVEKQIPYEELGNTDSIDNIAEGGIFIWSMAIGSFLTGIVYVALFFPLSWYSSMQMGLDPIGIILFTYFPSHLSDIFFSQIPPAWSNLEVRPILYALGNLYGVVAIVSAFMLVSLRINGLPNLAIIATGLAGGYFLTIYLAENLFGIIKMDIPTKAMLFYKLAYIFLAYYIFEGLKDLIQKKGLRKKKYEIVFDGLYGIVCTLFFIKGFGESIMSVLTGPLFLVCQFLTTSASEKTCGRVIFGITELAKKTNDFQEITPIKLRAKKGLMYLWQKIKEYKGEEIDLPFPPVKMWSVIRQYRILVLKLSSVVFIGFSIFPILGFTAYHFILEGRF